MNLKNFSCLKLFVLAFVVLFFVIGNKGNCAGELDLARAAEGYPYGYRTWTNITEEGVIFDEDSAFFGSRSGFVYLVNPFPCEEHENGGHIYEPGDRIVLEFSHVEQNPNTDEITIGNVLWLAVMTKERGATVEDAAEPTEETSGWRFQAYDNKKQELSSDGCFSCHKAQADNDFLFFKHE